MRAAASRFAKLRPGANQPPTNKNANQPTELQYQQEKAFWRRYRHMGLGASAFALGVILVSLTTHQWRKVDGFYVGIWGLHCRYSYGSGGLVEECENKMINSQNVVIGLLLFSLAFGLLATILACCGVLSGALAKKLYYFHSAGEIFFICFVTSLAAMITFPLSLQAPTISSFGFSYIIGWLAVACYLAAALCMCLDDLFRSCCSCRCCPGASPPPGAGLRRKPTIKTTPPPNNVDNS